MEKKPKNVYDSKQRESQTMDEQDPHTDPLPLEDIRIEQKEEKKKKDTKDTSSTEENYRP
ncbi:hypothetical protein Q75_01305 [Bacillus coahuilensis p1.1.43]|uniref:Uncharacterized protein n=1 Tax=Bacillus coahuilensis p1.1.43 TaxID=1150625 RepID=A0A147KC67_9BACI|nr:hypothetical protein [Bacillus coahuilensis]KUP09149.1 hypothetical protein Q75_01305 [Bacillus coahuilensis p1.1.43]